MWLRKLSSNIKSIAADVLDPEDEAQADGYDSDTSPPNYVEPISRQNQEYKENDIEWYKEEISRLRSSDSEIQELSKNYSNALRDKEEECLVLRKHNDELKRQLAAKSQLSNGTSEIGALQEKVKALQDELHQTINGHQEQITALQDSHRKRSDVMMTRHRREIETLQTQLKTNPQSSQTPGPTSPPEQQKKQILDLEQKIKKLLEKEKEWGRQMAEKEQVKEAADRSAAEAMDLKRLLEEEKKSLADCLQRLHQSSEEAENAKLEVQKMAAELAESHTALQSQQSKFQEASKEFQKLSADQEMKVGQLQKERDSLEASLKSNEDALARLATQGSSSAAALQEFSAQLDALKSQLSHKCEEVEEASRKLLDREAVYAREKADMEAQVAAAMTEKEKAVRDLGRLKQHLLDLEVAESEKEEQEGQKSADLEAQLSASEAKRAELERALQLAKSNSLLLQSRMANLESSQAGSLSALQQEVAHLRQSLHSKDSELHNLQIALGQYYAQSETQERLQMDLVASREDLARLSEDLRIAASALSSRQEELSAAMAEIQRLEQQVADANLASAKSRDDVALLRRALEQSMVRINRMSTDSDFSVDRRIVIKLLVTYFERNYSREVLDLMARMLGFSDAEKTKVGLAHQRVAGLVGGVVGYSGKLLSGFLRNVAPDAPSEKLPDENTSFSDLWIEFLLKESEEREKLRSTEAAANTNAPPVLPHSPRTPTRAATHFASSSAASPSRTGINHGLSPSRPKETSPFANGEFSAVSLDSGGPSTPPFPHSRSTSPFKSPRHQD